MGSLEELVDSLLGQKTQAAIKAENPIYKFGGIGDTLNELALRAAATGKAKTKDVALTALLGGITKGISGGLGDLYQEGLQKDYSKTVESLISGNNENQYGLSPDLFKTASHDAKLFALGKGKEAAAAAGKSAETLNKNKMEVFKAIAGAKDDREAARILKTATILGVVDNDDIAQLMKPGQSNPNLLQVSEEKSIDELVDGSGIQDPIAKQVMKASLFLQKNANLPPGSSGTIASKLSDPLIKEKDRVLKEIRDSELAANDTLNLANELEMSIQELGYQGVGGGIVSSIAGVLPGEAAKKQYDAAALLESSRPSGVIAKARNYKGPMSDKELVVFLRTMPSLQNSKEANLEIVDRIRYAGNIQKQWAAFMRNAVDSGVSVGDAQRHWAQIKAANPYVYRDQNTGKLVKNPKWDGGSVDMLSGANNQASAPQPTQPQLSGGIEQQLSDAVGGKKILSVKRVR